MSATLETALQTKESLATFETIDLSSLTIENLVLLLKEEKEKTQDLGNIVKVLTQKIEDSTLSRTNKIKALEEIGEIIEENEKIDQEAKENLEEKLKKHREDWIEKNYEEFNKLWKEKGAISAIFSFAFLGTIVHSLKKAWNFVASFFTKKKKDNAESVLYEREKTVRPDKDERGAGKKENSKEKAKKADETKSDKNTCGASAKTKEKPLDYELSEKIKAVSLAVPVVVGIIGKKTDDARRAARRLRVLAQEAGLSSRKQLEKLIKWVETAATEAGAKADEVAAALKNPWALGEFQKLMDSAASGVSDTALSVPSGIQRIIKRAHTALPEGIELKGHQLDDLLAVFAESDEITQKEVIRILTRKKEIRIFLAEGGEFAEFLKGDPDALFTFLKTCDNDPKILTAVGQTELTKLFKSGKKGKRVLKLITSNQELFGAALRNSQIIEGLQKSRKLVEAMEHMMDLAAKGKLGSNSDALVKIFSDPKFLEQIIKLHGKQIDWVKGFFAKRYLKSLKSVDELTDYTEMINGLKRAARFSKAFDVGFAGLDVLSMAYNIFIDIPYIDAQIEMTDTHALKEILYKKKVADMVEVGVDGTSAAVGVGALLYGSSTIAWPVAIAFVAAAGFKFEWDTMMDAQAEWAKESVDWAKDREMSDLALAKKLLDTKEEDLNWKETFTYIMTTCTARDIQDLKPGVREKIFGGILHRQIYKFIENNPREKAYFMEWEIEKKDERIIPKPKLNKKGQPKINKGKLNCFVIDCLVYLEEKFYKFKVKEISPQSILNSIKEAMRYAKLKREVTMVRRGVNETSELVEKQFGALVDPDGKMDPKTKTEVIGILKKVFKADDNEGTPELKIKINGEEKDLLKMKPKELMAIVPQYTKAKKEQTRKRLKKLDLKKLEYIENFCTAPSRLKNLIAWRQESIGQFEKYKFLTNNGQTPPAPPEFKAYIAKLEKKIPDLQKDLEVLIPYLIEVKDEFPKTFFPPYLPKYKNKSAYTSSASSSIQYFRNKHEYYSKLKEIFDRTFGRVMPLSPYPLEKCPEIKDEKSSAKVKQYADDHYILMKFDGNRKNIGIYKIKYEESRKWLLSRGIDYWPKSLFTHLPQRVLIDLNNSPETPMNCMACHTPPEVLKNNRLRAKKSINQRFSDICAPLRYKYGYKGTNHDYFQEATKKTESISDIPEWKEYLEWKLKYKKKGIPELGIKDIEKVSFNFWLLTFSGKINKDQYSPALKAWMKKPTLPDNFQFPVVTPQKNK